jgi:hypothetical protein
MSPTAEVAEMPSLETFSAADAFFEEPHFEF